MDANIIKYITAFLAACIILFSLIHKDGEESLSGAFGGSKDLSLFLMKKERGSDKLMSQLIVLCSLFLIILLVVLQTLNH